MSKESNKEPQSEADDGEELIETTILPEGAALGGDGSSTDEAPEDALAKAKEAAEENWNKYLRIVAELDNVRKRSARELEQARKFGVERLAGDLLGVADSLEMGLEAASNATVESLVEGKRATLMQLNAALEKSGIVAIYPEGEPFDPELHEALSMQPSATAEPNSVLAVVQRGYTLNGRLLRPARVIVARAPDES